MSSLALGRLMLRRLGASLRSDRKGQIAGETMGKPFDLLEAGDGSELQAHGSGDLLQALLRHGLADAAPE